MPGKEAAGSEAWSPLRRLSSGKSTFPEAARDWLAGWDQGLGVAHIK